MVEIDSKKTVDVFDSISKIKICWLVIAALLSSVGCAVLLEKVGLLFELPLEFIEMPMNPSNAYMARYKVAFREVLCGNYTVHFAIFGAMLGLAIGAVGAAKNHILSIAAGIFGGAIGGALFAAIGGFLLGLITTFCIDFNWETIRLIGFHVDPFVQTTALQCWIWACIGIGIGIGCTLPEFSIARIAKGIKGGVLGGLLAGVTHSLVAAVFYSGTSAVNFVPDNPTERMVWAAICGVGICIGLLFFLATHSRQARNIPKEMTTTR